MLQAGTLEIGRLEKVKQDSPQVLLVESDPDLRDALALACEKADLQVHDCATIALAQEACRRREMDLIVVDWVVEGFFADDLLKLLEAALRPRSLPTTLVLSRMGDADTRDCLRPDLPIHGVLTRPTNSEEFGAWAPKFAAVLSRCQRPRERGHVCMTA
jgi:DNA-binding response OmpR family regulator